MVFSGFGSRVRSVWALGPRIWALELLTGGGRRSVPAMAENKLDSTEPASRIWPLGSE